jgi:hypothetical protein
MTLSARVGAPGLKTLEDCLEKLDLADLLAQLVREEFKNHSPALKLAEGALRQTESSPSPP